MQRPTAIWAIVASAAVWCGGACVAQVAPDDNGEESFIRQAIPKLLGRKPKGALEVRLLLDIDAQVGRTAVARSLMQTDEFVDHWTNVLVDMLRLQRIGDRAQDPACFGPPHQTGTGTTSALAIFVRDQPPDTAIAPPGGAYNMIDLIRSSIVLDDLSPIYRAYPVPLTWKYNPMQDELSVGDAFNHALLNREPDCMSCHHSTFSISGALSGWDRTWPAPFDAEKSVYGPQFGNPQQTRLETYPIFRVDQIHDMQGKLWPNLASPWGMVPACGQILMNLASLPNRTTHFADQSGNQIGLVALAASFKSGSNTLKTSGLHPVPVANSLPVVPGDQGFAYLTAEKIVEGVWKEVLGSPLTIANYFPRNQSQRDVLLELTDHVFNAERWSLRALIADVMTGFSGAATGYFNREAPDVDSNSPAYRLPMTLDPWVQKDPRLPDPMPDPQQHFNGQGELVHRYAVQSLLHSVAAALGWPEPQVFPPAADFPNLQLEKSLGQFISDDYQGRDGVDFQGLLSWESQLGVCDKAVVPAIGDDWIDRLAAAVATYNAANPASPLTVSDVVSVMKDWLTGEAAIGSVAPTPLDTAHPPLSESAALAVLFSSALTTSSAAIPQLGVKLRRACGAILESPQFMLAGIQPVAGTFAPKIRVCNPGSPCTYEEMCHELVHLNGYLVVCGPANVTIVPGPNLVCPPNVCRAFSSFGITLCESSPGACGVPTGIPGLEGPPVPDCLKCGLPWVDLSLPTAVYVNAPNATILEVSSAEFRAAGAPAFLPLRAGQRLTSGAIVRLYGGSMLRMDSASGGIRTPEGGMPAKNDGALSTGDRELLQSVEAGQTERVSALLAKGAHVNVNARDRAGRTPLMIAARGNNAPMVAFLLAHGANAFAQSPHGLSAADFAALGRHTESLAALARVGATAKSRKELARVKPEVEEPWYVFIGHSPVSRLRRPPVKVPNNRVQRHWEEQALASRGEAGPALTEAQQKAALARYMATGFSREHPARPQ